jgi:hypothetical protein
MNKALSEAEDIYVYSSGDEGGDSGVESGELEDGCNDEGETPQYMSGSESSSYVVDYRDLDEMSGSADDQFATTSAEDQDYVFVDVAKSAKAQPSTQGKLSTILTICQKDQRLDESLLRRAQADSRSSEADGAGFSSKRDRSCGIRMMDRKELQLEMNQQIQEVSEILSNVPREAIPLLLQKCHWSNESLLERYMGDTDRFLQEAGVFHRCSPVSVTDLRHDISAVTLDESSQSCPICYWRDYLCNAINQVGSACVYKTTCPEPGCTEKVTELEFGIALVKTVVSPNPVAEDIIKPRRELDQFYRSSVLEYVKSNPLAQYCPGHGCDRVALALSYDALQLEGGLATCDQCCPRLTFCVHCAHFEPHAPASCQQVQLWKQKCRDIPDTRNWMVDDYSSRRSEEGVDIVSARAHQLQKLTIHRCNMLYARPDTYVQIQLKDFKFENKDDWKTAKWLLINTKSCPRCLCPIQKANGTFDTIGNQFFRCVPCLTPPLHCLAECHGRGHQRPDICKSVECPVCEIEFCWECLQRCCECIRERDRYVLFGQKEAFVERCLPAVRLSEEEEDTVIWMLINTKCCPKCQCPIQKEKGGKHSRSKLILTVDTGHSRQSFPCVTFVGCSWMLCGQCLHGFCWGCLYSPCRCGKRESSDSKLVRGQLGAAKFVSQFKRFDPVPASDSNVVLEDPSSVQDFEGILRALDLTTLASTPTAESQVDAMMPVRHAMDAFLRYFEHTESDTDDWDMFLQFCKQFYYHQDAQGTLNNLLESKKTHMISWQSLSVHRTWAEAQFLEHAHENLFDCRRVLKYSRVLEYFSPSLPSEKHWSIMKNTSGDIKAEDLSGAEIDTDDSRKSKRRRRHVLFTVERFQYARTQLEEWTEKLTEALHRFAANQEIDRFDVINQTNALRRLGQNFLCCAEDSLGAL